MSAEYIEVESRAELSPEQRARVLGFMATLGEITQINRVMVDYGSQNGETVVVRINNGIQEVVTKQGDVAAAARMARDENPTTALEQTLADLAAKGRTRAMISWRYLFVAAAEGSEGSFGIEYSLRDVFDPEGHYHTTLLEAEALGVRSGQEQTARAQTDRAILAFDLQLLEGTAWKAWIHRIHHTVDQEFTYTEATAQQLVQTIGHMTATAPQVG